MKQFMKHNTVTYNLMSFTGFKSLLIFALLCESPKTYKQLQTAIKNHEYLKEEITIDALRIYLNSLREIGCEIEKTTKKRVTRYSIKKHPFELKISDEQTKSIIKIYKAISKSIDLNDFMALQQFFNKISQYISNENLILKLQSISPLNKVNPEICTKLLNHAQNNDEIKVYYNSGNSGKKYIDILVDKVAISNGKLYVYGINSEHKSYSSLLVEKIIEIASVNLNQSSLQIPTLTVTYELAKIPNEDFIPEDNEKIIKETNDKYTIEITSKNKFELRQKILSMSNKCKVIAPAEFKEDIISCLKKMKEGYIEGQ